MTDPPRTALNERTIAMLDADACEALAGHAAAVAFAPGRVNLIGDHTDYNGGLAFPAGIDVGCVAAMSWGDDDGRLRVHAADLGEQADLPFDAERLERQRDSTPRWARYIAGVLALGRARLEIDQARGIRCAIASSVPLGSGLSSSAAIEVAVATAMEALAGRTMEPLERARWCQAAEHRFAGTPCGLLDQLASIHARAGHGMAIDFATMTVEPAELPPETVCRFVLLDSSVSHENADGGYADRREACERAARVLGVPHLAHATIDEIDDAGGRLSPDEAGVARHVVTETQRVRAFRQAAAASDPTRMGALMIEAHHSMATDFRASHPLVDQVVTLVSEDDDVYGARMTGGGFGGFVVALVRADGLDRTLGRLRDRLIEQVGVDPALRVLSPGAGARVIRTA